MYMPDWIDRIKIRLLSLILLVVWPAVVLADFMDVFIRSGYHAVKGIVQDKHENYVEIGVWASWTEHKLIMQGMAHALVYGEYPNVSSDSE